MLPAEHDDHGYLDVEHGSAQGRIRLTGADADTSAGRSQREAPDTSSDPYDEPTPEPKPPPESISPSSGSLRTIRREREPSAR